MYKQLPGRNHRSKGIKVKNVLQICLLLAVCFWLIYQVKHSHDKKKEFDEDDSKSSIKTESSNTLMKFGRKDLPQIEGSDTVNEKHKEEPEDEEGNKPEEEDLEENNTKEKNDEHREDEVDDHDQEKNDEHREDEVDDHDQEKNDEHREDGEDEVDDHDQEKNDEHREDGEDEVDDHDQEKNDEHREDGEDEVDDHDQEKNDEHREDGEDEVDDHDQEKNDEHREDGEDEVDDHDQEKSDGELDKEESVVDEDKEREEDNEKETEERDSEVNDGQVEEENSLEDHDHDEDSGSSHEAREEHYKADDASSAVTHDTAVTTTENENDKSEKEAEGVAEAKSEVGINNIMQINADQHTTVDLKVEDGKADGEGSPLNTTNSEEKHDDSISSTSADASVSNSTSTEGLTDNSESSAHSIELSTQTHDLFLQNGTQAVNQEYNVTIGDTTSGGSNLPISSSQQNGNSAGLGNDNQIDSNSTFSSKQNELDSVRLDSSNVSGDTEPSLTEKVVHGNATVEAEDNVGLPLKDNNEVKVDKADTSSEEIETTDEGVDASIAENLGEVQHDPIDSSDSFTHLEEKHIRTDVETLPEIQTEGNMEDAAAE